MDCNDPSSEDETPNIQTQLTQSSVEEIDTVFKTENQIGSVGTRIKQGALAIHNQYVQGVHISAEAKLVMDLGLSSILDLTHEENAYQKYIFSVQGWKHLKGY